MEHNHLISGEEVIIEWEIIELIEDHGSGCKYYALSGEGANNTLYIATGIYQGDELQEITDIEQL